MLPIWCYTACYNRVEHLSQTLPPGIAHLEDGDRWLVANVGADPAVRDLCEATGATEICMTATGWDVGAARNALLGEIPDLAIALQVDADNFLSAATLAEARRRIGRYQDLLVLVGPGKRGPHGRVAGLARQVRAIGGWPEGITPPGSCHEVEELVKRARFAEMLVKGWRSRLRWLSHPARSS